MDEKKIAVIGSTGSIGKSTLDIARKHKDIKVKALAAKSSVKLLEQQIREFRPEIAAVYDLDAAKELKIKVADTGTRIVSGISGVTEASAGSSAELVITSLVGMIGLRPTVEAIKAGKNIGLANKETLVCAGELITRLARENNVSIIPVDSEHSAIFQCLRGSDGNRVKKLILTASGGPFFGKSIEELENVTPEEALRHPNWSMGSKITIDSATLANKGLEFIEAHWLFKIDPEDIEIVIHRESIIHSAVEYYDGSVIAQMGVPDMKIPIQYAITYPERVESDAKALSLADIGKLTFFKPDYKTFTGLEAFIKAMKVGGTMPAAVNAANEEAVGLFLHGKISFNQIGTILNMVLNRFKREEYCCVDDILEVEKEVRKGIAHAAGVKSLMV